MFFEFIITFSIILFSTTLNSTLFIIAFGFVDTVEINVSLVCLYLLNLAETSQYLFTDFGFRTEIQKPKSLFSNTKKAL